MSQLSRLPRVVRIADGRVAGTMLTLSIVGALSVN
jgi:hypothetical protein